MPTQPSITSDFRSDQQGNVAIMAALFMMLLLAGTALAVDIGSLYTERRALQGAADLAAVAGAGDIDHAEAAVRATFEANSMNPEFRLERGQYTPDPELSAESRFIPGQKPYNAVRVVATKPGQTYFAKVFTRKKFQLGVSSIAANASLATFSVGSRLAAVRGGVANAMLAALTGSQVTLSAMDYNALVSAKVELLSFMNALATDLNVTGGTYSDVLNANATFSNVAAAAAKVAEANGDAAASVALNRLAGQTAGRSIIVPLTSVIDLGPFASLRVGDPAQGLDAALSAMDLVSGSAVVANGTRQVELDLTAEVPGVLKLMLYVAIGEPPQHSALAAVGQPGSTVRTQQTRLWLIAEVGGQGVLANTRVRLPLYLDLAYGEGRLASVTCTSNGEPTATIAARSGIAEAWIGEVSSSTLSDFTGKLAVGPARIVDTSLLKVSGRAHVDVGSQSETPLTFDEDDVRDGTIKRTDTNSFTQAIVTSLLRDLKLSVNVLGIGAALPGSVTAAVAAVLAPVTAPLDEVVYSLLTTLGVHLGEADVRVYGMRCGSGVLAG